MGGNFIEENLGVSSAEEEPLPDHAEHLGLHPDIKEIMNASVKTQLCIYGKYDELPDCPHGETTRTEAVSEAGDELHICTRKTRYEQCLRGILKGN